jgi:hypothetical protein
MNRTQHVLISVASQPPTCQQDSWSLQFCYHANLWVTALACWIRAEPYRHAAFCRMFIACSQDTGFASAAHTVRLPPGATSGWFKEALLGGWVCEGLNEGPTRSGSQAGRPELGARSFMQVLCQLVAGKTQPINSVAAGGRQDEDGGGTLTLGSLMLIVFIRTIGSNLGRTSARCW